MVLAERRERRASSSSRERLLGSSPHRRSGFRNQRVMRDGVNLIRSGVIRHNERLSFHEDFMGRLPEDRAIVVCKCSTGPYVVNSNAAKLGFRLGFLILPNGFSDFLHGRFGHDRLKPPPGDEAFPSSPSVAVRQDSAQDSPHAPSRMASRRMPSLKFICIFGPPPSPIGSDALTTSVLSVAWPGLDCHSRNVSNASGTVRFDTKVRRPQGLLSLLNDSNRLDQLASLMAENHCGLSAVVR